MEKRVQEIKENMKSNTDYIEWLISFCKKNNNSFNDNDWNDKELDEANKDKVKKLFLFISVIGDYAAKNNIEFRKDNGYSRTIKYNDTVLEIGLPNGTGEVHYAKIIDKETRDTIDFNDILKDAKREQIANLFIEKLENKELDKYIFEEEFIPTEENVEKEIKEFQKILRKEILKK